MFFGVIAVIALWFVGALAMPWLQRDTGCGPGGRFPNRPVGDVTASGDHPASPTAQPLVDSGKNGCARASR